MKINLIFRSIFSLNAIYQLRKTPIILSLIVSVFLGILHFTPHSIAFVGIMPHVRHIEQIWELDVDETKLEFLSLMPRNCYIENAVFYCDTDFTIDTKLMRFGYQAQMNIDNGLIFTRDYFYFVGHGNMEKFAYHYLNNVNFDELAADGLEGYEELMQTIALYLRRLWIIPFISSSYMTGIISYFAYIFTVSVLSMLLKFGHTSFLSFKEVLNILIFSSIGPVVGVIVIGFIFPALTTLLFNLATPLVAWFVYKKYVVPSLHKIT